MIKLGQSRKMTVIHKACDKRVEKLYVNFGCHMIDLQKIPQNVKNQKKIQKTKRINPTTNPKTRNKYRNSNYNL